MGNGVDHGHHRMGCLSGHARDKGAHPVELVPHMDVARAPRCSTTAGLALGIDRHDCAPGCCSRHRQGAPTSDRQHPLLESRAGGGEQRPLGFVASMPPGQPFDRVDHDVHVTRCYRSLGQGGLGRHEGAGKESSRLDAPVGG